MEKQMEREESRKKKTASDKASMDISNEARYNMIAEADYYRAQKRGFQNGDPVEDWLAAEAEVDEQIREPVVTPSAIVLELKNDGNMFHLKGNKNDKKTVCRIGSIDFFCRADRRSGGQLVFNRPSGFCPENAAG